MYGANASDAFTAWKLPIFAFVSFSFGMIIILLCVLFIAPRWRCGIRQDVTENEISEEEDEENKNMKEMM